MNLVNELQSSAESEDVLTVLRKTKRLATKLDCQDIEKWLNCELKGYGKEDTLPPYRKVSITFALNTNGYVPNGLGMAVNGVQDIPLQIGGDIFPIGDSISAILSYFDNLKRGHGLYFPLKRGEDLWRTCRQHVTVDPRYEGQITYLIRLNAQQVKSIPEHIKNHVLDWALNLEKVGITGEGLTFSIKDREVAQNVTFNINNSKIEQLTNSGVNKKK